MRGSHRLFGRKLPIKLCAVAHESVRAQRIAAGATRAEAGRPSDVLNRHIRKVLELIAQHHGQSAYVFGSVSRAEDTLSSDIDLMVDFEDGTSLLDHAALYGELTDLLAPYSVDLVSKRAMTARHSAILADMRVLV